MEPALIVVAGATGHLGGRIAQELLGRGAHVRALVRAGTDPARIEALRAAGAEIAEVDFRDTPGLTSACAGAACVVSALSGLRDVIVDAQSALLDAAVAAGVPRFIPSDYAIDFAKLSDGSNRNFDLRRAFRRHLDAAPIAATSVLCGMFTDLLTGSAPVVLFKFKRVLYWGDPDQPLDFTTVADTAAYTARAALDPATPRFLRIAGDTRTARQLADDAGAATGERFRLFRAGSLQRLGTIIKVMRRLMPAPNDVFPPWQGMQYLHNMFEGRAKLAPLDNARYPDLTWTSVREVLAAHAAA